jgi:hypothetical protein
VLVLSLSLVLHEAARHSVDEIVIEPGQPITFHGEQGVLVLGDELAEASISDALSLLLAPEQQAELAVAGLVEFYVEGHNEWSFIAESGSDGVVIRGRIRDGGIPEVVGVPLDLPPLEPFEPDGGDIPHAPVSALRQTHPRTTRWDVNVAGSVFEPMPPTGSGAIEDTTLPPRHPVGRHDTDDGLPPRVDGSPLDGDGSIDFALVGRGPPTGEEMPDADPERASTMPRLVAARPTLRGDDTLAMHIDALDPGTVVYLAGIGVGERLLQHLEEGFELVDLDSWDVVTTRPFEEMPTTGRGYLVRLEDPSRCLAWLLRRLEEGARIVVESRSRTAAGARRSLLGVEATPHVVGWLDTHRQLWLRADGRTWVIERV